MIRQLRLIIALTRKDIKLFVADRRAAVLCFVVPILLASAFGMIFDRPSQHTTAYKLPLIVVDEDDSPFTRTLIADLQQHQSIECSVMDRALAERSIDRRAASVAVILPKGFGETVGQVSNLSKRSDKLETCPTLQMLHHPMSTMESQWAEGILTELIMKRGAQSFLAPLGLSEKALQRPFSIERRAIPDESARPFNSMSHSFSGMTLQYLLFWGMDCGLLFLRERQRGIWGRMRVAPVPLVTTLLGRIVSTTLLAVLQIALTFTFGYFVFGVRIRSFAAFAILAVAVSLLAAGVGLLIASLGRTEACARSVCIVVILTVSMIGGLWLPAFLLPGWARDLSVALPTSWAMRGFDGVTWQGQSLADMWPNLLMVTGFSFGFLIIALMRFHFLETRHRRGEIS